MFPIDARPALDMSFLQVTQCSLSVFVSLVLSVGGMSATLPDCEETDSPCRIRCFQGRARKRVR